MSKSFKDWLQEGEEIYNQALSEYHTLEAQLEEIEAKLAEKKEEVNQIASMIGKPTVESTRRPGVQIIDSHDAGAIPASRNTIARALTGRGLG